MSIPDAVRDRLATPGDTRVAVVGATDSPGKYGGIITRDLLRKGFQVSPVNPRASSVAGLPAVAAVGALEGRVHIVNFVVPAYIGRAAMEQLDPSVIDCVWFQPGSFDAALVAEAERRFRHVIAGPCIMVEAR